MEMTFDVEVVLSKKQFLNPFKTVYFTCLNYNVDI